MAINDDINKILEGYKPEEPEATIVAVVKSAYGTYAVVPGRLVNGIIVLDMAVNIGAIVTDENLAINVAQIIARGNKGPVGA